VRDFVQRLAGYFLTGGNAERVFVNFWGAGRNGKTQLKELMLYCSGNYARACSPDAFLTGRRTGTVRDDLHSLRGARLVAAVEPNKIADLDEATVKEVTGGDTISTRGLYGKYDDWKVEFKPLLVSNHKLTVRGTDDGIWDRLVIVPFAVRIADKDVVADYFENKLKPEVNGYLQWALAGLRAYWRNGLQIPDEVRALVKDHRQESDVVRTFIDARCVINHKAMAKDCVGPEALKEAFTEYCRRRAIPYRTIDLNERMMQLGYEKRQSDRRYWAGVTLPISSNTKF
jgi:putative DNA primase/helicase